MGFEAVGANYPGDSTRTVEARRGDSGEACGMHGGMETDQGSGGHTCGETTANLTRDDYKQR